jgi:predicted DNA-binding WGR domain protein
VTYRLRHIDPDSNRFRWYTASIQNTLFGEFVVVREYGRIGRSGRLQSTTFPTLMDAQALLSTLHRAKLRKGYRPLKTRAFAQLDLFG